MLKIQVMKVALSYWQNRIAPVFDVAGNMMLVEVDSGRELRRHEIVLRHDEPLQRAQELAALDIDVLICGAVSDVFERRLRLTGMLVLDFICGPVSDVLNAFLTGQLADDVSAKEFVMPGCRGQHTRIRSRRRGNPFRYNKKADTDDTGHDNEPLRSDGTGRHTRS